MHAKKFVLRCVGCGETHAPPALRCDRCDGLLRTDYAKQSFDPREENNLFDFRDWLPSFEAVETTIGPVTYRSEGLAEHLGLDDLVIAFNGYAPEVGARNPTGSFKDFEALPTLLYFREYGIDSLVLASAGNTARAFAYAATLLDYPVIAVVPKRASPGLWLPCKPSTAVRVVLIEGSDDYAFAIDASGLIAETLGVAPEGGVRNVARRDGMSTTMLEYARRFGGLPAHYVQAIGSGTGAIAVWEAALRLRVAGIGASLPALHLAQNAPFTPVHDAWTGGGSIDPEANVEDQLRRIARINAPVLANRTPPYAMPGGVRDALAETGGSTYAVTNEEARGAAGLFRDLEGLSVGPAAAVATAAMIQAVRSGRIGEEDAVLLHITGNNDDRIRRDFRLHRVEPVATLRPEDITQTHVARLRATILP